MAGTINETVNVVDSVTDRERNSAVVPCPLSGRRATVVQPQDRSSRASPTKFLWYNLDTSGWFGPVHG